MPRPRNALSAGQRFAVIPPLARGLDVLRAFRAGDPPLRNQEIARRTAIPPSSVSRLTGSLVALGYLAYDTKNQTYALTPAVLSFSYALLAGNSTRHRLQAGMQELANQAGAVVSLGMQDQHTMVYLACCKGQSAVPFRSEVGSRFPLANSAMGWAYLAALDEAAFGQAMTEIEAADPAAWPVAQAKILKAREQVRVQGFCVSIGEWESGVHTVGVPVLTRPDEAPYGLTCGAPAYQLREEQLVTEIGPRLVWLARSLLQDQPTLTGSFERG